MEWRIRHGCRRLLHFIKRIVLLLLSGAALGDEEEWIFILDVGDGRKDALFIEQRVLMIVARRINFRVVNVSKLLSLVVSASPNISVVSSKSCITFAVAVFCSASLGLSCPGHCFLSILLHLLLNYGLIFSRLGLPGCQGSYGFGFIKLTVHQIVVIFLKEVLLVHPSHKCC